MKIVGVLMFIIILAGLYFAFSKLLGTGKLIDFSYNKASSSVSVSKEPFGVSGPPRTASGVEKRLVKAVSEPIPPSGFTVSDLSPYYKKVRVGSVRPAKGTDPGNFEIRGESSLEGSVSITGWRVRDNKNNEIRIPQAISDYRPAVTQYEGNINLKSGDYVRLYGSAGPFKGLRLNKCTGFLSSAYTFNPTLPKSCPAVYDRGEITSFSGVCQNYIQSLSSCEVPDLNEYYSKISAGDSACRSFIDRFNYQGCYNRYYLNSDFYSREWRMWLNQKLPFDPFHDRIILFDSNGKVVYEHTY